MPKQRITKDMVVQAAFEIARKDGMEQVMVKNIADRLACSVQPIYSYCKNMEGLRQNVIERVRRYIKEFVEARIDKSNLFRSTGQAYVQMAKEEPNLYKIFILHERQDISSLDDLYQSEATPHTAEFIAGTLNISISEAKQLHLNMLIYTIGLGAIFAVTTPGISTDEIFTQQQIAYEAFLKQALENKEANHDGT